MEDSNKDVIKNVQMEMLFVGALYKNPSLFIKYGKTLKAEYDFYDEAVRFFYICFEDMYKNVSEVLDETKVNLYMTQSEDNLKTYRKYGGYKFIAKLMQIANVEDIDKYYKAVKKYALLREYSKVDILKIMQHPSFNNMSPENISDFAKGIVDKVKTNVLDNSTATPLSGQMTKALRSWLVRPQMGLEIPFELLNEMFRGLRLGKLYALGFLSNDGKTRLAVFLAAYVAFINNEKIMFFANETDEEDIKSCLLTTIINNPCFVEYHGINIGKCERDIVLGIYRDDNGNIIERKTDDDWGEFIETEEEYIDRVQRTSSAFRKVLKVAEWIDKKVESTIFFERLTDYSDENLAFKIKEANTTKKIKYFIYDTLKSYKDEQWSVLKQTTTMLSDLMGELKCCMWVDIQLTDDSVYEDIFKFSSNNIASAKHLKHVLDHLILGKRLAKDEYSKYKIVPNNKDWGMDEIDLDPKKTYYGFKIDKNRGGNKDKIPALEVNLDLNTWKEVGYLIKS